MAERSVRLGVGKKNDIVPQSESFFVGLKSTFSIKSAFKFALNDVFHGQRKADVCIKEVWVYVCMADCCARVHFKYLCWLR